MSHLIRTVIAAVFVSLVCVAPAAAAPTDEEVSSASVGLAVTLVRASTKALALTVVPIHQFASFDNIISNESGWDVFATNPSSGAYGLGQALPPEKMATHGVDWRFNPITQLRWTYDYMIARYGGPDQAWAFWRAHHWY